MTTDRAGFAARCAVSVMLTLSLASACDTSNPAGASASPATTSTPRSGYAFQSADTRALQDDPFANPGTLWLDQGESLWQHSTGDGKSCSDCHDVAGAPLAESMRGVALRYPLLDQDTNKLLNLEGRINRCRTEQQQLPALQWESEALLALTTLIANRSHGLTLERTISPELQPFFEAGRAYFYTRRGQMNLACNQCHEQYAGRMLRGDRLSEGHSNGYPSYRLQWQAVGSLQRRLRFCNVGVRAEPHEYGAPEYLNLELFLQWRGQGLPVETPAVRR